MRVEPLPNTQPGTELYAHLTGSRAEPRLAVELRTPSPSPLPVPLRPGEMVIAQVLDRLPTGNLLIEVKGTPLEAVAPEGLSRGEQLPLRVEQVTPQAVFRILPRSEEVQVQALQLLRSHLSDRAPAAQVLTQLEQALAPLIGQTTAGTPPSAPHLQELLLRLLPADAPPTPEGLQTLVRDGGLQLEARLAEAVRRSAPEQAAEAARHDLKAVVLRVLHEAGTAAPRPELQPLVDSASQVVNEAVVEELLTPEAPAGAALDVEDLLAVPFPAAQDPAELIEPAVGGGKVNALIAAPPEDTLLLAPADRAVTSGAPGVEAPALLQAPHLYLATRPLVDSGNGRAAASPSTRPTRASTTMRR